MLDYFVWSDSMCHIRCNLMACIMGLQSSTEHIDEFWKCLGNCADISEAKAKFIFEMNLADWLSELVLLHNCADFHTTILYTE